MDIFQLILLIFELMLLVLIFAIPWLIMSKVVRTLIRSLKKTFHTIFN